MGSQVFKDSRPWSRKCCDYGVRFSCSKRQGIRSSLADDCTIAGDVPDGPYRHPRIAELGVVHSLSLPVLLVRPLAVGIDTNKLHHGRRWNTRITHSPGRDWHIGKATAPNPECVPLNTGASNGIPRIDGRSGSSGRYRLRLAIQCRIGRSEESAMDSVWFRIQRRVSLPGCSGVMARPPRFAGLYGDCVATAFPESGS